MKMDQEKLNLTWHTFTDHLRGMLLEMMISNEFTDVTLITDDKKYYKAHKVILCASSPMFKNILSDNTNTLIYLRGIQSGDLELILQFIYTGETTLYQDRMNEFFNVAKNLEIKEISKEIPEKKMKCKKFENERELPTTSDTDSQVWEENLYNSITPKAMSKTDLPYPCDQCNKRYYDKSTLNKHRRSIHEGKKYPCDKCPYKATQQAHLKSHISLKHEQSI